MNQNIHEANQKKIKQKKTAGIVLALVGAVMAVFALVNGEGSVASLIPLGLVLAVAGIVFFLVNLKKGIDYARYLEQEASRPKSMAEKLAQQQAQEVEEQELHKEAGDMSSAKKSHVGLGALGAVIGCLIGTAAWVYIMGEGYITVFGGILMILLSFGGYKLFSLNLGTDGMPVSVGLCVIALPFATYGGFIRFLSKNISGFSGYRSLSYLEKWQQTWGCCGNIS